MLSCKQACALLSAGQDRKLSLAEKGWLLLHLAVCPHCRRYRKQLRFIRSQLHNWQERE